MSSWSLTFLYEWFSSHEGLQVPMIQCMHYLLNYVVEGQICIYFYMCWASSKVIHHPSNEYCILHFVSTFLWPQAWFVIFASIYFVGQWTFYKHTFYYFRYYFWWQIWLFDYFILLKETIGGEEKVGAMAKVETIVSLFLICKRTIEFRIKIFMKMTFSYGFKDGHLRKISQIPLPFPTCKV